MRPDATETASSGWMLVLGIGVGAVTAVGLVSAIVALMPEPPAAAGAPKFVEQTSSAGVDHVYDGEFEFFVGGGVAVFDCNSDGLQDLYLAGGTNPSALYVNRSQLAGALSFSRSTSAPTFDRVTGAYPLDVDGDGKTDLAVLRHGESVMLRGLGDCVFEQANESWRIETGNNWTVAFSATWEDESGLPTLAFGNYLEAGAPRAAECTDHLLLRPEDVSGYGTPLTMSPGWCTLSILFSDWSGSGRADLRMTNDRHYYSDGEEQLWRMEPDEVPAPYTRADGWQRMQIWGMGIASHDLTSDGRPEIFLTSQSDNKLQTLAPDAAGPSYVDIAFASGATVHRPFTGNQDFPSTAWHAEFQDVNNDTFMDLLVVKGNVEAQEGFAMLDPNNLLLGQPDGTFVEAAEVAGVLSFSRGRGGALADLNLDGQLDLVVVNRREPTQIWRNLGSQGNWLGIRLVQDGPNRDAIGAKVQVAAMRRLVEREMTVGGGHAGGQLGPAHFGLGDDDVAEVQVIWPDGEVGPSISVQANQFITIRRGSAEPVTGP